MFDLITGTGERPLRERSFTSKLVAIATHVVVIVVVIAIPLLRVTNQLPELPTMRTFVVEPSAPPPPPPPPPPARPAGPRAAVKSVAHDGTVRGPGRGAWRDRARTSQRAR